jgi:hypothetical protein
MRALTKSPEIWTYRCDACDREHACLSRSQHALPPKASLEAEGWTFLPRGTLCPECTDYETHHAKGSK